MNLKNKYVFWSIVAIGITISIVIALAIGLNQSVWFDESYSIMIAKKPLSEMLRLTALDTHPPFYYLILKMWGNLFGWGELALRSLSAIFMAGATFFGVKIVKKLFNNKAAIVTLVFLILAPFLLRYGFEIRMYSLASLIGISATFVLISALEEKNAKKANYLWAVYGLLVATGVYTLYYTVLIWLTHLVWLVLRSIKEKQNLFKTKWFKAYILSVLLFLPWLPNFINQLTNGALAPITQPMNLSNIIGVISFSFLYQPSWQINTIQSILIIFVFVYLVYMSILAFKLVDKSKKDYLLFFAMYWLLPILFFAIIGLFKPMYIERYLAHFLIGQSIYLGLITYINVNKYPNKLIISVPIVIILILGVGNLFLVGNYNYQRLQPNNTKLLKEYVKCDDNSIVFVDDPYYAVEMSYYLDNCPLYFYSQSDNLKGGFAPISNQNRSINDPENQLAKFNSIYHIYYKKSDIKIPDNKVLLLNQGYDDLKIDYLVTK